MQTKKHLTILLTITIFTFVQLQGCATTKDVNQSSGSITKNTEDDSSSSVNMKTVSIGAGVVAVVGLLALVLASGVFTGIGQNLGGNIA